MRFHGTVSGMTSGSAESKLSHMPTLLELLAARQGLAVFFGLTLSAIGIIASLLRWFRIEE
jgi:hypothetical protein